MVQQRSIFSPEEFNLTPLNKAKTELFRKRINRFKELVKSGEIPSAAKKIVLEEFKLDRAPNAGTPKWMTAGREELIREGFDYKAGPPGPKNDGGKKKAAKKRKGVTYDIDDRLKKDKIELTKGTNLGKTYELAHTANIFQAKSLGLDYPIDSLAIQPQKINNKVAEALYKEMKPLYKRQLDLFKQMKKKNTPGLKKQMDLVNYNLSELVATGGKQGDVAKNVLKSIHVNPDTVKPYVFDGGFNTSTEITASSGATSRGTAASTPSKISYDDFMSRANLKNLIKSLTEKEQIGLCNKLSAGGLPGNCASAIDNDPVKTATILDKAPATSSAMAKVKNAASAFLKFAGKGKVFGVTAGLGVGAGALVKKFMNDDPSTYLTNDAQANAMILDTIDEKERQERMEAMGDAPELLDEARIAGEVGVTAAAIPGSGAVYGARKKPFTRIVDGVKKTRPAMGTARAALGPVGKALSGFATPAGIAALTPLNVASSLYEGDSGYEIATDPLNYLAPAFAGTLSKEATRGMGATSKLAKVLRLGMSPGAIKMVSRRFGLPGLALSSGISLYELADEYKSGRGMFGKKE